MLKSVWKFKQNMAKSHKTCMEQAEIIDTFGTYQQPNFVFLFLVVLMIVTTVATSLYLYFSSFVPSFVPSNIIVSLLEEEQELSLGMVICPKHIYNFCLLHAWFVWLCRVLLEFSYTFDHIWTNLLTQCTQLPVPVFCCFCISGFPAIKSAPKIPEKLYKK